MLILTLTAAIGCNRSHTRLETTTVRLSVPRDAMTWGPIYVAQSRGYFQKEGLTVTISDAGGLSKGMEALLGGSVDVTAGAIPSLMQLATQGRYVRSFLLLNTRPMLALIVAPGMTQHIRSVADLKGRNVGVSSPGSATHQFVNFLLASKGMSTNDIAVVSVGTTVSSIAALERGRVDAATLVGSSVTTFARRHPKAMFLADTRTAAGAREVFGNINLPNATLVATDDWLTANPETASRFARAVKSAMQWVAGQSPEQVRSAMPEDLRMPDIQADLEAIEYAQQALSADGAIPVESLECVRNYVAASDERVRAMDIDFSKLYTNKFVVGEPAQR